MIWGRNGGTSYLPNEFAGVPHDMMQDAGGAAALPGLNIAVFQVLLRSPLFCEMGLGGPQR